MADFDNNQYYTNRELSWIQFNYRVMEEARDKANPLLERLKFLSITASNLDEFFMVRVASLKDMVHADYCKPDISGMTPQQQLKAISEALHTFIQTQYSTFNRSLMPMLEKEGIKLITSDSELSQDQQDYVDAYFKENVYPVLTPMAVDASRPFPLIRNKSLNIAALIRSKEDGSGHIALLAKEGKKESSKKDESVLEFATVQVPAGLARLVALPSDEGVSFILLEEIIRRNIGKLFLNYDVICAHPYRIERNADLSIDEEEAEDLLKEIQKQLKQRQWGEVIKLEVSEDMDKRLLKYLKKEMLVSDDDIYKIPGPLDLTFLMKLYGQPGFDHLKEARHVPCACPDIDPELSIFDNIKKGDIFLHHPYITFDPVVDFIKQASRDVKVLAIKQTLYRVSGNSPIVLALAKAAENGKQVTVLVELKARFDEEHNIVWAKMLEKAGCHVIYGLRGLKTHSKITLIVREEDEGICRYVHLGTGNYNDATAKLYTDCGIMTCNRQIGEDATAVFNMLSGYSEPESWNKLAVAPLWLRGKFLSWIHRETAFARSGRPAKIIAKMNSLCDKEIIAALYEASSAGVEIHLIVRGICCVKAGIPGVSENIHVRSIVGKFLEHSRIFLFENGGAEEVYMGSADWMPRNLDRRVEITFPVVDMRVKEKVKHILEVELADTVRARVMLEDGTGFYERIDRRGREALDCQEQFCKEAEEAIKKERKESSERLFVPLSVAENEEDADGADQYTGN